MTELEEACSDITAWLPRIAVLTGEPDRGGTAPTRSKPRSRPPWNSACSNALFDALEGIRRLREDMLSEVTNRYVRDSLPHAQTGHVLESIPKLSRAVSDETRQDAAYQISRYVTTFLRLTPIDLEQPPRILPCPRCARKMLRYWENTDKVACYGCNQQATISIGYISGEPMLKWADGWVAPVQQPEGLAS